MFKVKKDSESKLEVIGSGLVALAIIVTIFTMLWI